MSVIYHASGPPPWKDGGATVENFETGLTRVSQSYVVPTNQAQFFSQDIRFRAGQPFNPAISEEIPFAGDPLIIFPNPTFTDQGNGFTKIDVTAYSRWTTDFYIESDYEKDDGAVRVGEDVPPFFISKTFLFPVYRIVQTQPKDALPIPDQFPELQDSLPICDVNGIPQDYTQIFPPSQLGGVNNDLMNSIIARQPSVAYGEYQEVSYTLRYRPFGWGTETSEAEG